jgi:hypothetical protein
MPTQMQAKLSNDGKWVHIKIPVLEVFLPSKKTGKTLLVSSSEGTHKTGIILQGSDVRVTANAFIPNPAYKKIKKQRVGPKNDNFDDF